MIGILDACFIIDWSLYNKKEILKEIFSTLYITSDVFNELKTIHAYDMIINWRGSNLCVVVDLTEHELKKVRQLMRTVDENPAMPAIDFPEATALVYAKEYGIKYVLTENKGAKTVPESVDEFSDIQVWGALEILNYADSNNIGNFMNLKEAIEEYCVDTKHFFKKQALKNFGINIK